MRSSRSKPKPRLQSWLPNHSDLEQYRRTATEDYGGVGFCGRSRPAELERRRGLDDLPALHLWRRPALRHDGGLQPQAEAVAARSALEEAVQALATHLAARNGVGT